MSISKELLSEVLDENVHKVYSVNKLNELTYELVGGELKINIHELAHKCKEWAFNHECELSSWYDGRCGVVIQGEECWAEAETEPEAIFKACQWILDNRTNDEKQD